MVQVARKQGDIQVLTFGPGLTDQVCPFLFKSLSVDARNNTNSWSGLSAFIRPHTSHNIGVLVIASPVSAQHSSQAIRQHHALVCRYHVQQCPIQSAQELRKLQAVCRTSVAPRDVQSTSKYRKVDKRKDGIESSLGGCGGYVKGDNVDCNHALQSIARPAVQPVRISGDGNIRRFRMSAHPRAVGPRRLHSETII